MNSFPSGLLHFPFESSGITVTIAQVNQHYIVYLCQVVCLQRLLAGRQAHMAGDHTVSQEKRIGAILEALIQNALTIVCFNDDIVQSLECILTVIAIRQEEHVAGFFMIDQEANRIRTVMLYRERKNLEFSNKK